ncbi:inositol monophosphatase 2 isoform X1 [Drosophila elegans]|uniref:inositol monophosphatase 2 isoform X1 n=1 Tax=Drosophila elegans TaxID=30023 RepID=UPI0007E76925|nr:inositol monophosphatase 2 isoform X1 [Drosophila elegans]
MAASKSQVEELYDFIYPLAIRAGEILLEGYENAGRAVSLKDGDFYNVVTAYDNQIEEFLVEKILASYPDHKFIGNKLSSEWLTIRSKRSCIRLNWAKVPFAMGNPSRLAAASISTMPMLHMRSVCCTPQRSGTNISRESTMWDPMPNARLLAYSAVVDSLCMVAAGNLDAFHIEDMYPWDCAAGYLLIREAGGVVTHPYGGPFDIMKPDLICAGTETLRAEIEQLIRKADQEKHVGGE